MITIDQKIKILDKIGKKSYTLLCEEYGIGRSTITDIKKRESELRNYKRMVEMGAGGSVKVMKLGKDEELEIALYQWFKQKREQGVPITGPIINKAKALELHTRLEEVRGDTSFSCGFTASSGWLWRFCKRHGIRELSLQGEKLSTDWPAAVNFVPEFQAFISDGGYSIDQLFNCDETGLYYQLLPQKTLAGHFEKSADGRKTQRACVTINACSNATGSIKLPLLFIGKAKNPRCFRNFNQDNLPVIYRNQANAWVNGPLFKDWYHHNFVPFVQDSLREMGIEPKAILLLDNCSAHPNEEELISADGNVISKFLPPNVTSLVQPMDQGVLASLKRHYHTRLLKELVLHDSNGVSVVDFLKGINMLKAVEMIASSWNEIHPRTLRLSWRKIIPLEEDEEHSEDIDDTCVEELHSYFQLLGENVEENEITEWLDADSTDRGYSQLTDDEIIAEVTGQSNSESVASDDPVIIQESTRSTISHGEALQMFDNVISWLRQQDCLQPIRIT